MKNKRLEDLEIELRENQGDNNKRVDLLVEISWRIGFSDSLRSLQMGQEGLELSQKLNYEKGLAYSKRNLALYHFTSTEGDKDIAMQYFQEALKWFEDNDDVEGEATINSGLSVYHWGSGDFQKGFDYAFKALEQNREAGLKDGEAWILNTLGGFYHDWHNYQESLEYCEKALEIFTELEHKTGEARALNGIGNAYFHLNEFDKAQEYIEKSLAIHRSMNSNFGASRSLNDIGLLYQSRGDYETALKYHGQSLELRQQMKYVQGETTTLIDMGAAYAEVREFDKAIELIKRACTLSERIGAKPKLLRAHLKLSTIYKTQGEFEKSLEHHEIYHRLEDEVHHEDSDKRLENLRASHKLEVSQREAEIYRLRNVELKTKNDELEKTLSMLNATQAQLLQSAKVIALGKLASGIVHEMNTPAGAIGSTVDVNERALDKIIDLREAGLLNANNGGSEKLDDIVGILRRNNGVTVEATNRIIDIVKSLKNFTRLDEADYQLTDIHEGLESTLTLLGRDRLEGISIVRNYGVIPEIKCYAAELNQVFMNLILNAVNALDSGGELTLTTERDTNAVVVQISDSGKGIPNDKIKSLFEPGFTEKDARVRMRTGLYSSYNIIHKHNGEITVNSEIDQGTTFRISLPISE